MSTIHESSSVEEIVIVVTCLVVIVIVVVVVVVVVVVIIVVIAVVLIESHRAFYGPSQGDEFLIARNGDQFPRGQTSFNPTTR